MLADPGLSIRCAGLVANGDYDTHAGQGVNQGSYFNLMGTLNDGLLAFYMPVVVWGAYLNLNAWFMYQELNREEAALARQPQSVRPSSAQPLPSAARM